MRISKNNKKKVLELLEENPNLLRACKKTGIARSTLYRWMESDSFFRDAVRDAQEIGQDTMNDYIESKLIENARNGIPRSIEFYLRHNNTKYASNRVEADYLDKRGVGRTTYMPVGVDGMYYSEELKIIDNLVERLTIRRELEEAKIEGKMYDPDEPINIESLGKVYAEEFYRAFPDAKEKIAEQMQKYHLKKRQQETQDS